MRITQRSMYNSMISDMNKSLSDYVQTNMQASSQKRINRPSDDPVGMTRVLAYRASIEQGKMYEENTKDAASWLASTDSALTQAQVIVSQLREKAEQASNGTLTQENRFQIAEEVRQLFYQLVNVANTQYAGQQLFAGHQFDESAFQVGLGLTTYNPELQSATRVDGSDMAIPWEIQGELSRTTIIRFDVGAGTTVTLDGTADVNYSYSKDGGLTWVNKTLAAGSDTLDVDGATVKIPMAGPNPTDLQNNLQITGYDPAQPVGFRNGTMLFVRPAAYYQGDTNDPPPLVDSYSATPVAEASAHGIFKRDIRIRLDSAADLSVDGKVNYSYSTDNGITWTQAADPADTRAGATTLRLNLPDGYLDITPQAGQAISAGDQFVVRPRRANMGLEIADDDFIPVTNCGKDIFGGLYIVDGQTVATPAEGGPKNIFETISRFIAALETGTQEGCQIALDELGTAMEGLLTEIAKVGGKINRTSVNLTILESNRDDKESRLSKIEDADLTELLTRLTQQQMAYQTVLQSSSMIMQLNLTKFL